MQHWQFADVYLLRNSIKNSFIFQWNIAKKAWKFHSTLHDKAPPVLLFHSLLFSMIRNFRTSLTGNRELFGKRGELFKEGVFQGDTNIKRTKIKNMSERRIKILPDLSPISVTPNQRTCLFTNKSHLLCHATLMPVWINRSLSGSLTNQHGKQQKQHQSVLTPHSPD